MNNRRDHTTLLAAARLLRDELAHRSKRNVFRPVSKLTAGDGWTDGWYVPLGLTAHPKFRVDLWLDRYAAASERRFYYGFCSREQVDMNYLLSRLPTHLHRVRTLSDADYEQVTKRVYLLRRPLKSREFNVPVYEQYERWPNRFYGVYVPGANRFQDTIHRMVKRAADFLSEVMWLLPKQSKLAGNEKVYPQLERAVVRKHLVRERRPELAKACKRRDGFRCQVCRMTFAEVYGEDLGAEFAEAHHLRPLSRKRANEKTTVGDLVTVCANCHRMLHLMRGREHDLDELRQRVRKHHRR